MADDGAYDWRHMCMLMRSLVEGLPNTERKLECVFLEKVSLHLVAVLSI